MSEWIILDPPVKFGKGGLADSFRHRDLSNPGTMIRTEDGSEYLIGDINELGGGCDDCPIVSPYDVIIAYRVMDLS